ncbi:BTB/POZ domain-containing protein At2g13690-like [Andrographis paniculata]|uniref:BTB/POZ domain-containing protein At2g13690-like n=1 Tax=Andrographis paniculata TaxID=175694 RepID=UPI0021E844B3|nr:BTB/POZ domain-containing protein At2g13690-like [Andrographis paniculata]
MHASKPPRHHHHHHRRRRWCCSFTTPPLSPDNANSVRSYASSSCNKKTIPAASPQTQHQKLALARRILSPGRVSPITDHQLIPSAAPLAETLPKSAAAADSEIAAGDSSNLGIYDVRLSLKGKNGGSLVLELGSEVLTANSPVFANLISDYRRNLSGGSLCRIEVPYVENLNVFRETIELMFEEDIQPKLLQIGVFRAIDILEVSAGIKFERGISSCLKYLEAVPWTEEEEEKLSELFGKLNIDEYQATNNILDRFSSPNSVDSQRLLTKQLICSITTCTDATARNELKSLVKDLLCKSSVYEKDCPELNKDDIYAVCKSCLSILSHLLEKACGIDAGRTSNSTNDKPALECISKQVDNLNWLLDILLDHQMAGEFADLWANQDELIKMHEDASPMVRYELSRVSAMLFIAVGTRKLHCPSEMRLRLLQAWFKPMLSDFGWLQRCKKGLDIRALEEAMGQALLTLPLKEQYSLFMDWFYCFSKGGTECPNLSKAFQIWWRRSFLRGSETFAIESR